MILIKLNNVVRLAAYVGLFVTAIFYLTNKVIYMYGLAFIVNAICMIFLIFSIEKKAIEEYDALLIEQVKEEWTEANGKSPAWLLWLNLLLPILFVPAFFKIH